MDGVNAQFRALVVRVAKHFIRVHKLHGQIQNLFPTTIFKTNDTTYVPMANELFSTVDWEKYKHKKYNKGGLTTYFNHSEPLPEVDEFDKFKQFITGAVHVLAREQGLDLSRYRASIEEIWLNSMHNGAIHERHAHPGAHYSGTYYVNNPEGASRIKFYSPLQDLWGLAMPPIEEEDLNYISAEWVQYDPVPGNLLIWNSWLYHEVLENKSITENRNTISFNIVILEI